MASLPKCVVICGPTASGKSGLAESLADTLPIEIISADSAQVYRSMDIGTAKPDEATRARIPHHLIDIRDPLEPYSAADFCTDVVPLVVEITERGNLPVIAGGTMLYLKALKEGMADLPAADPAYRRTPGRSRGRDGSRLDSRRSGPRPHRDNRTESGCHDPVRDSWRPAKPLPRPNPAARSDKKSPYSFNTKTTS